MLSGKLELVFITTISLLAGCGGKVLTVDATHEEAGAGMSSLADAERPDGDGGGKPSESSTELPESAICRATTEVLFGDQRVEAAVKEKLGVPDNSTLSVEDVARVGALDIRDPGVTTLQGLECATTLESLTIFGGTFEDLSPLLGLPLRLLYLADGRVRDVSQLATLQRLDWLYLDSNQVVDVAPIAQLSKLYNLSLIANQIRDITPLLGLHGLGELLLDENPVDCSDPMQRGALKELEARIVLNPSPPPVPPDRQTSMFFVSPCH